MEDENEPTWHGYFYAVCLLVVCELRSLLKGRYIYGTLTVSHRTRTSLMAAVYNKVGLELPFLSLKHRGRLPFSLIKMRPVQNYSSINVYSAQHLQW